MSAEAFKVSGEDVLAALKNIIAEGGARTAPPAPWWWGGETEAKMK